MHEFSIIQNIVDIVKASALKSGVSHVNTVEIEVGQASGVVTEAMQFAWQSFTNEQLLLHAQLIIREIPLQLRCNNCKKKFSPKEVYEPCPFCGEFGSEILKGRELKVIAIET